MDTIIAVYLEDLSSGGQFGFKWFNHEDDADKHLEKVRQDIIQKGFQEKLKAVKRYGVYNSKTNSVSFI